MKILFVENIKKERIRYKKQYNKKTFPEISKFINIELQKYFNVQQIEIQHNTSKQMRLIDCYKILNIQQDCSDLEVRTAYRRKAKLIHPDKQVFIEDATSKFSQLNQAYKNIISHRKRLNKIKFKIIHQYQKQQRNSLNNVMPIYDQMQKTYDNHMKTLQQIQLKLKQMKNITFKTFGQHQPIFSQFCD